jgi:hypothetical protein
MISGRNISPWPPVLVILVQVRMRDTCEREIRTQSGRLRLR